MTNIRISVIIPTHARAEILRLALNGLCSQTDRSRLAEVIVVSDGQDDLAESTVRAFANLLPVLYLEQPKRGVSSARNLGISAAKSPVLLLLDDDVVPCPDLIGEHARFHDGNQDLEAVLLGYVTWHPSLHVTPFMRWYGEYGALFGYSLLCDKQQADKRYFYSCNISLKREFILRHDGFNKALTVLEDNELGYRLAQDGMQLFFQKSALAYHYQTFTFAQSCLRLEHYSTGLNAFLATSAGRELARRRRRLLFRFAEVAVRVVAPLLGPLIPLIDTDTKMPNFFYRLLYWNYAACRSFWLRADKRLLL